MAHISIYEDAQGACIIINPAFAPATWWRTAHNAFQGINSCRVPIYYTWAERDNCG